MEVISLTEGKINRTYIAGKDVITKQSSFDETYKHHFPKGLFC